MPTRQAKTGFLRQQLLVAQAMHLWQFTCPMRLRSLLHATVLISLAMLPGAPASAQEKKPAAPARKPTPAKPTPAKPTPAKPTPAKPAPAKPAPATPAKPPAGGAAATGGGTGASGEGAPDQNRGQALVRAISAQEKSEKAGEIFRRFIEGSPEERSRLVADSAKNGAEVLKYFSASPNRDFKPLSIQILGTVTSPSVPDRLFFPYFVATDKNPLGFVAVVVETAEGFRVDWTSFVRGHDLNLDAFFTEKKPGSSVSALLGISRAHIFSGEGPAGGEAKFHAFSLEMPPPPVTEDAPKAFIEKDSETGKLLSSKLGWTRGHLCWLTVTWEGSAPPVLKIKAYQPYAK